MPRPPRAVRSNNPGNIRRRNDVKWQGEVPNSEDIDPDFEVFVAPEWGFRALVKQIHTYFKREDDGVLTIREAIYKWAPPTENNTAVYVTSVSKALNQDPDYGLNVYDPDEMFILAKAIALKEIGYNAYPDDIIMKGVKMGLE